MCITKASNIFATSYSSGPSNILSPIEGINMIFCRMSRGPGFFGLYLIEGKGVNTPWSKAVNVYCVPSEGETFLISLSDRGWKECIFLIPTADY